MAIRKATNKAHNKKLRRRRDGLSTKCFEYGELDGAELALFIYYPKRGDFYSYMSKQTLSWLQDVPTITSHSKARIEYPDDLRARVEDARRKMRAAKDADVSVDVDAPGTHQHVLSTGFPDFKCNLTMLTKRLRSRATIGAGRFGI
ncbi:hypothetical protein CC86DRAFT_414193 [Ophiobolus disseminans]|uniref:MADS-box domain-containing protein n=1 Tax=Ophiobolus disseminans TaxID=1469910 RepID=A0A6A6ZBP1_9PLEO|nr:hypothetical protein CC86DRAFT_414193 [Ophiobolus disseminans]